MRLNFYFTAIELVFHCVTVFLIFIFPFIYKIKAGDFCFRCIYMQDMLMDTFD